MIAPEGKIILVPLLLLGLAGLVALQSMPQRWLPWATGLVWLLALFSLQFFRDPNRPLPDDQTAFVSPADGKVVAIKEMGHDDHIGGEALRITIFLNVFNVHVQKVPFDASVDSTRYQPGKFLAAFNHKASEENEQAVTYFSSDSGNFIVSQIAGLIARRILNYMESGTGVNRGDRLGYIRFGSRVDVTLPSGFIPKVEVGDQVRGSITTLGHFGKQD